MAGIFIGYNKISRISHIFIKGKNELFPDHVVYIINVTEWIFRKEVPVDRMRPDPATPSAEIPVGTLSTPAPKPCLFFPEPGENRIGTLRPELTERPVLIFPTRNSGERANWQGYTFPRASMFATRCRRCIRHSTIRAAPWHRQDLPIHPFPLMRAGGCSPAGHLRSETP